MCRLALINRELLSHLGEAEVTKLFDTYDACLGGDGIGVAALFPDGKVSTKRGLKLDTMTASKAWTRWFQKDATWFLFHCRRAASGIVSENNVMPFRVGSLVIAHNGVAWGYRHPVDSDTLFLARVVQHYHLGLDHINQQEGVYIGFYDGKPYALKPEQRTDLLTATVKGNKHALGFVSQRYGLPSQVITKRLDYLDWRDGKFKYLKYAPEYEYKWIPKATDSVYTSYASDTAHVNVPTSQTPYKYTGHQYEVVLNGDETSYVCKNCGLDWEQIKQKGYQACEC